MNITKTLIGCLLFILIGNSIEAQATSLEEGLKKGFDTFADGETFKEWMKGVEVMGQVGKEFPNDWLPEYWASYFCTQLIFNIPKENPPKGISNQTLLVSSQKYLDTAKAKVKNMTPEIESDFHALQALIYNFNNWASEDEIFKKDMVEKRETEVKSAIRLNPNNPLLDVSIGIDLINRKDYASVYAGRIMLLNAKQKYSCRFTPRYMSTHWNEQWIETWLSHAQKGIIALTNEKK